MELTNRFFRAPHTHRSAYSLCASGHRRVLEYSLSYSSSTRVTNYSVSAARHTGTVFMLGKTARRVTCCQGIAPLYSRSSTHLPFDVTGTAHALMVVMAVILVTMSSFSVVVDLVAFSTTTNKILRILQNAPRETHVADLYITFNTLTLPNLHNSISCYLCTNLSIIMSYCQIFFRHTSQKNLIYILTTLALKTNHTSNYLLPLWGNVL